MRISDWSSDVCSSDLAEGTGSGAARRTGRETAHWRCADADMADACVGDPNLTARGAKQLHQCIARRDRSSAGTGMARSEEHTSELQSLMRISYAVFCLKKKIL